MHAYRHANLHGHSLSLSSTHLQAVDQLQGSVLPVVLGRLFDLAQVLYRSRHGRRGVCGGTHGFLCVCLVVVVCVGGLVVVGWGRQKRLQRWGGQVTCQATKGGVPSSHAHHHHHAPLTHATPTTTTTSTSPCSKPMLRSRRPTAYLPLPILLLPTLCLLFLLPTPTAAGLFPTRHAPPPPPPPPVAPPKAARYLLKAAEEEEGEEEDQPLSLIKEILVRLRGDFTHPRKKPTHPLNPSIQQGHSNRLILLFPFFFSSSPPPPGQKHSQRRHAGRHPLRLSGLRLRYVLPPTHPPTHPSTHPPTHPPNPPTHPTHPTRPPTHPIGVRGLGIRHTWRDVGSKWVGEEEEEEEVEKEKQGLVDWKKLVFPCEVRGGLSIKRMHGVSVPQFWRMGRVSGRVGGWVGWGGGKRRRFEWFASSLFHPPTHPFTLPIYSWTGCFGRRSTPSLSLLTPLWALLLTGLLNTCGLSSPTSRTFPTAPPLVRLLLHPPTHPPTHRLQ